ncbi:peptidoglycan-binding protein, partial [Paenibacillus sepulcri]|nr:peptidoglycan-binding protein [Paenibacillus sepulcri]
MFKRISLLVILFTAAALAATCSHSEAVAPKTLQLGSKSQDVPDLQFRLQLLDYFKGALTQSFGKETSQAVMRFQQAHGLSSDGIAGPA